MVTKTVHPAKTALLNAFSDFLDEMLAAPVTAATVTKAAAEEGGALDRDEVNGLGIVQLRKLAADHGITEKKKADILSAMDDAGLFSDSEDEEEEDEETDDEEVEDEEEDDEDDADEDEDEGLDRDELEEMDLKELKALAKEQGHKIAEYKGLDQEGLIDLLLGEDEDEEDEDEEEDDEEEEIEISADSLKAMSETELRDLAKSAEIKILKADKKPAIIKKILAAVEEED